MSGNSNAFNNQVREELRVSVTSTNDQQFMARNWKYNYIFEKKTINLF